MHGFDFAQLSNLSISESAQSDLVTLTDGCMPLLALIFLVVADLQI